ncbi:MAG TPA: SDR family oxidoreductase [Anaerolineales bacterium]|nr:SDR family oxidoreductase [Anaerolineales bacterium]
MKIVVFGASRGVGLKVVEQALQAGHTVTAFVRTPSTFTLQHPNLTVFQGDSMDAVVVEKAIAGQEAVVSTLGPTRPPVPGMMETSARSIVAGMKKHGIRRLISTTGAGVRQPEDQPKFADYVIGFLLNLLAKSVVLDSAANVKVIQNSDLDWTVIRFPRLIDGDYTGKYRVGYVSKDASTQLSRADGAAFVLKELTEKKWLRKLPLVSY